MFLLNVGTLEVVLIVFSKLFKFYCINWEKTRI